jgi:hypothetical protein
MMNTLGYRHNSSFSYSRGFLNIFCLLVTAICLVVVSSLPVQAEEPAKAAKSGPSTEELKQANNPLANMSALNIQNYYVPKLSDLPDKTSNTTWARLVFPTWRILWRASLPLSTVPGLDESVSGLGDLNAFAAFLVTNSFGVGPLIAAPTATDDALGTGKWQGGAAVVYFNANSPLLQFGGLATWQASFAGDEERDDTNLLALQYFAIWQLGNGTYLRSAPIWGFNLEKNTYNVPLGLGIGKVLKVGNQVYNMFIEPQYTVLHDGIGQPELQIFGGVNIQFLKKKD